MGAGLETDRTSRSSGKERDIGGEDYLGARYYAFRQSRFLTPDWSAAPVPVPYASLGSPQTLNLYAYVQNNPITGIDPEGHLSVDEAGSSGGTFSQPTLLSATRLPPYFDYEPPPNPVPQPNPQQAQTRGKARVNPTSYPTPDAAAMAAEKEAVKLTNQKNGVPPQTDWEFGGWVVMKGKSFYYTRPVQGTRGEFDVDSINVPKGFTKVAGYHTHPDGNSAGEGFSGFPRGDVGWSENHTGGPMVNYVGMTFSGNVRVYIPNVTTYSLYGITGDLVGNVYK